MPHPAMLCACQLLNQQCYGICMHVHYGLLAGAHIQVSYIAVSGATPLVQHLVAAMFQYTQRSCPGRFKLQHLIMARLTSLSIPSLSIPSLHHDYDSARAPAKQLDGPWPSAFP